MTFGDTQRKEGLCTVLSIYYRHTLQQKHGDIWGMFIQETSANSNDVIYSVVIHGNQSVVIFLVVNSVNRLFSGWWLWITHFVDHHFYFALTCWISLIVWWQWSINEYWILEDVSLATLFACIILSKKTKRTTVCKNRSELWQDHIVSKACYTYIDFFPSACRLKKRNPTDSSIHATSTDGWIFPASYCNLTVSTRSSQKTWTMPAFDCM